jgi:hypothetical protein
MAKQKTKAWTEFQLKRLPDSGYWIEEFFCNDTTIWHTGYCQMNGRIKYIRDDLGNPNWYTLQWNCMPTRNQIIEAHKGSQKRFHHFNTIQEMQDKFPNLHPNFYIKPENDF